MEQPRPLELTFQRLEHSAKVPTLFITHQTLIYTFTFYISFLVCSNSPQKIYHLTRQKQGVNFRNHTYWLKYCQLKSNNYNLGMRNYQFKTINPQLSKPANGPRNNPVYSPPPQQTSINFRIEPQQPPQPPPAINTSRVTVQQQPLATSANSFGSSSESNIQTMKRQLEMLVKQTDYIEKAKNIPAYENNQSFSAARSLSSNPKLVVKELPERNDKAKNYQKYQKYLQQPLPLQQNSNLPSGFKNTTINTINGSNNTNVTYQNKNRSYTSFPLKPEEERKKMRNFNQFEDSSSHVKTQPAQRTQIFSQKIINFGNKSPMTSPVQPKAENPQRAYASISFQENYTSLRPKTQAPEQKMSVQVEKKQNYEQYFSPNTRTNYGQTQFKQYETSYKSPAAKQTFENQYRPSPRTQTQKTEIKQLEVNLVELQNKFKNVEAENQKLKEGLKAMSENKEFYRNELQIQRNKITILQESHNTKILQLKAEFQKQRQSHRKQIEEIHKLHENDKQKIRQSHGRDLQKQREKHLIAAEQIKKASQVRINQLKQEIENKKSTVASLIKEMNDKEIVGESTQSQLEQSNDMNNLYSQIAQKEYAISQLHSELNSRAKHIQMLNQTFAELKAQIEELKGFKQKVQVEKYENFDEILLTQMQTISQLKNMIESLNEKLNEVKLNLIEANRANESLENDIRIMEFKHKAEINMIRTQGQIEVSNKDNTISSLNKKMQTMQDKLKFATNDIKTKDDFIKQYLVGRSGTPEAKDHVEEILKKYQQSFSQTNEQKLRAELEKARKQLQLYEKYA